MRHYNFAPTPFLSIIHLMSNQESPKTNHNSIPPDRTRHPPAARASVLHQTIVKPPSPSPIS
ncbi:hypothetical protein C6Q04_30520 [Burkholderia multivorans]|nr:hypothetical protein C6Q04_30520 [Burkholderia multivorans]PRG49481.1 hypothetical protein C6T63_20580 [Burkholderia multivorans]